MEIYEELGKLKTKAKGTEFENSFGVNEDKLYLIHYTDDLGPKEAYDNYLLVQEQLKALGVFLPDAQIEHDCISGFIEEYTIINYLIDGGELTTEKFKELCKYHGATHHRDDSMYKVIAGVVCAYDCGEWKPVENGHNVNEWLEELEVV